MRPPLPHKIQLLNVGLGNQANGTAGAYATADATVTARVINDTTGVFRVTRVETDDVVIDPDGPGGRPVAVLEPALQVDGPGPIQVSAEQAIQVFVEFSCPPDPPVGVFQATIVLDGANITFPVLATANLGTLELFQELSGDLVFSPGEALGVAVEVASSLGHDVTVTVKYEADKEPHFTVADGAGITVPRGQAVGFLLDVTCAPGTPTGDYVLPLSLIDGQGTRIGGGGLSATVPAPPRPVTVTTNLPERLELRPATSTDCQITITTDNGPDFVHLRPSDVPPGIDLEISEFDVRFTGKVQLNATINVSPHPPFTGLGIPDFVPTKLFCWTINDQPNDTSDGTSGDIVFDVRIVPQETTVDLTKDPSQSAGDVMVSVAKLTLVSNGGWAFEGQLFDNGTFAGDKFAMTAFSNFTTTRPDGSVDGFFTPRIIGTLKANERRQFRAGPTAAGDQFLRDHWQEIFAARVSLTLEAQADLGQLFTDLVNAVEDAVRSILSSAPDQKINIPTVCVDPDFQPVDCQKGPGG
jgi:hypothetical protein